VTGETAEDSSVEELEVNSSTIRIDDHVPTRVRTLRERTNKRPDVLYKNVWNYDTGSKHNLLATQATTKMIILHPIFQLLLHFTVGFCWCNAIVLFSVVLGFHSHTK
jgi:hypothetical protein